LSATARRSAEPRSDGATVDFESAYREHFAFVWRSLVRLGVPERDVADAAQDVFVVVHRRFDSFDSRSRLTSWLYGICLRVASDRRRSAGSRHEVLGDDPDAPGESVTPQVSERRVLLAQALDAMTLEQRAVFTLFELEGMTGEEIAEMLQIPAPTVHSRLRLARETFRRVLARDRAREAFDLERMGVKGT
jgi:RNA polymerase sigma-70 factor, ECF subfamily